MIKISKTKEVTIFEIFPPPKTRWSIAIKYDYEEEFSFYYIRGCKTFKYRNNSWITGSCFNKNISKNINDFDLNSKWEEFNLELDCLESIS
jgi:hypothetical protein